MSTPRLFGTDGIRDRYGHGMLLPDAVTRVVRATARVLCRRRSFPDDFRDSRGEVVLIGRDTRASGTDLLETVAAAFIEQGHTVVDVGVLPTAGVALTCSTLEEAILAVVLTASHNPAEDNGIKFLAPTGAKISAEFERAVEREYAEGERRGVEQRHRSGGRLVSHEREAWRQYVEYLVASSRRPERLQGRRIFLDTAHGATSSVAPEVFRRLGMVVETIGDRPDGANINRGVGALHPERLAAHLAGRGACVGLCFDGDGDRVIPISGSGAILDGDYILALAGRHFGRSGRLPGNVVVATVMSNVGLELALGEAGIELRRTDVGDRNVYVEMARGGHPLGGEQSGHIIFFDDARTGDGILAGVRLLDVLESDELDLDREARIMQRYPQVLESVTVSTKRPFEELAGVLETVRRVERELAGQGRVVLRYSGTEPLARVMVEGPERRLLERFATEICEAIRRAG